MTPETWPATCTRGVARQEVRRRGSIQWHLSHHSSPLFTCGAASPIYTSCPVFKEEPQIHIKL